MISTTAAFVIVFGIFFFTLAIRLPIAFGLIGCGILGYILIGGVDAGIMLLPKILLTQIGNVPLMVIAMFVLAGSLVSAAGVTRIIFDLAYRWLGALPGGLAVATVGACSMFAAVSGSSVATTIAIGKITVPQMQRYGYSDEFAAGTAASSGLLGIMIPPSIPMVIYGIATGTSIAQLLIAGILPGLLTALVFSGGIVVLAKARAGLAPPGQSFPWKERFAYIPRGWGVILLFGTIVGGIYTGIFSPTEAGSVGALIALVMAVKGFGVEGGRWQRVRKGFVESVPAFVGVYLILVGGLIFSSFITRTGIPSDIAEWIVGLGVGKYPTLILILLFYIPLGMFLDPTSMFLITFPFFFPVVVNLGFHPVWFGVIIVTMIEVANLTPPIGMNVFACKMIAPDIPLERIFKGCLIFLGMELSIILPLLIIFPEISLFLPSRMF